MTPIDTLLHDIERSGHRVPEFDWERIALNLAPVTCKPGEFFMKPHFRDAQWFFLAQGVAATEQARPDRSIAITRFFQPGQLICLPPGKGDANSSGEGVCALTVLNGVSIADHFFRQQYDHDTPLGGYLRKKVLEAMSFDHEMLRMRAVGDPAHARAFLETHHREVLRRIPPAFLERFMHPAQTVG